MNSKNNDFFTNMMKVALMASLAETQKIDSRKLMTEMFDGPKMSREYLEHHPSIETDVTDKDMLLLQIDMALDSGDMEMFMRLTDELKGMGILV